jgi:late competence protein required for DNA uptake (superfamily II DNA/RNA helicase)
LPSASRRTLSKKIKLPRAKWMTLGKKFQKKIISLPSAYWNGPWQRISKKRKKNLCWVLSWRHSAKQPSPKIVVTATFFAEGSRRHSTQSLSSAR